MGSGSHNQIGSQLKGTHDWHDHVFNELLIDACFTCSASGDRVPAASTVMQRHLHLT